jgi:molecular chaperone GrpE
MSENEKSESKSGDAQDTPSRFGDDRRAAQDDAQDDGQPSGQTNSQATAADSSAKAEVDKWKNEYLYLRAEFENFKKQVIKERSDLRKYGSERMVSDLLGVLDIFETALSTDSSAENSANFRKGIEMTATEMRNVLTRHGVTEIASHGLPFDPAHHEALSSEESADIAPGSITRVFKKPYKLHDRVVRPGQVVVAKAKS